jgi:sugar phosphate isomerase/epimerase
MHVAAVLTSLPDDFGPAARRAAALGFTHVDVVARGQRDPEDLEALADTGLVVGCAALGRGLLPGHVPDAPAVDVRRAVLEELQRQVADAARLGATRAYLVPGTDPGTEALARFGELCTLLADFAGRRMVRLCVEHFPGRALPTVAATVEWLDAIGHANLGLLLDVGHCLISREDPARAVSRAGPRLGHVHLNDNDGMNDSHRPLLSGCLTEAVLRETIAALWAAGYDGGVGLEFRPDNGDPEDALRQGKALVERLAAATAGTGAR